ncbi:MAG TPA: signal peptidase I [Oceanospirillales bacterium]|jgi:signal peptidase I|uniref:signal peptidase I n=1 Tax=Thalassolituus sp. UBA2590 TaxID=1947663 RepID=UPI000EE31526|nr:signal peptidase I [Thalassolituus sp. UBA2590]MEC8908897.1 signal peptidase I [Pseudomonadota bacterium]MEE3161262.1 signal peptidase I [Pseudomonadota bacterium]MEE3208492.1 signal peptidase I [Pseudomonadota bacterium]HCG80250.1 signal peptidase I [Oceanospirillales bacterium]|tara:strand:+ start:236 stop:1066 length:831 start_codon:yes stop_codon:yes gene_type:complete
MELDLPLILMVATGLTGLVVLVDRLFLRRKRQERVDALEQSGASQENILEATKEPFLIDQSRQFFPVLALVFVLRSFAFEPFQIPSGSMEPGLQVGDFILVSKFSYGLRVPGNGSTIIPVDQPQRGDVMVFFPPEDSRYFIKRVIGLPGDHIVYRDLRLTVNGEPVPTEVLGGKPAYAPTMVLGEETMDNATPVVKWLPGRDRETGQAALWGGPEGEWTVPDGHYFMMGDNRGNSGDSRMWGFVPEKNIVGKAVAVWMHWESWTSLPSFDRVKVIE